MEIQLDRELLLELSIHKQHHVWTKKTKKITFSAVHCSSSPRSPTPHPQGKREGIKIKSIRTESELRETQRHEIYKHA